MSDIKLVIKKESVPSSDPNTSATYTAEASGVSELISSQEQSGSSMKKGIITGVISAGAAIITGLLYVTSSLLPALDDIEKRLDKSGQEVQQVKRDYVQAFLSAQRVSIIGECYQAIADGEVPFRNIDKKFNTDRGTHELAVSTEAVAEWAKAADDEQKELLKRIQSDIGDDAAVIIRSRYYAHIKELKKGSDAKSEPISLKDADLICSYWPKVKN